MMIKDPARKETLFPGLIGPLDEDTALSLLCQAEAGEPEAQISWWQLRSVGPTELFAKANDQSPSRGSQAPARARHGQAKPTASSQKEEFITTYSLPISEFSPQSPRDNYFVRSFQSDEQHYLSHFLESDQQLSLGNALNFQYKIWSKVRNSETTRRTQNSDDNPTTLIQASLEIPRLTRADLGQEYMCLAKNNELVPPLNASIKLNLNCK